MTEASRFMTIADIGQPHQSLINQIVFHFKSFYNHHQKNMKIQYPIDTKINSIKCIIIFIHL